MHTFLFFFIVNVLGSQNINSNNDSAVCDQNCDIEHSAGEEIHEMPTVPAFNYNGHFRITSNAGLNEEINIIIETLNNFNLLCNNMVCDFLTDLNKKAETLGSVGTSTSSSQCSDLHIEKGEESNEGIVAKIEYLTRIKRRIYDIHVNSAAKVIDLVDELNLIEEKNFFIKEGMKLIKKVLYYINIFIPVYSPVKDEESYKNSIVVDTTPYLRELIDTWFCDILIYRCEDVIFASFPSDSGSEQEIFPALIKINELLVDIKGNKELILKCIKKLDTDMCKKDVDDALNIY